MTRKRTQQLRSALGATDVLDDYYDRDYGQQIAALGVEVVKKKPEATWYKRSVSHIGQKGLGNKISFSRSGFSIGDEALKILGGRDALLDFAVSRSKLTGEATLLIRHDKNGFKIIAIKNNSYRVGSRALTKWLIEEGIPLGEYKLEKIENGWLAMPITSEWERR